MESRHQLWVALGVLFLIAFMVQNCEGPRPVPTDPTARRIYECRLFQDAREQQACIAKIGIDKP